MPTNDRALDEHWRVIVIGASLGGLEALCKMASGLPPEFRAAVLIVLHTGTSSVRMLANIIGRYTSLAVTYGGDRDSISAGRIYIAPPDVHMIVDAPGVIRLEHSPKVRNARPAADRLFQTAAETYGRRVIGVVLTGGDHDGADGLKAVHASGGVCVVQHPETATAPSMPVSALAIDHPDHIVHLEDMAALLAKLSEAPRWVDDAGRGIDTT